MDYRRQKLEHRDQWGTVVIFQLRNDSRPVLVMDGNMWMVKLQENERCVLNFCLSNLMNGSTLNCNEED